MYKRQVLAGTSRGTERGGVFSELVRGGSRTPAYLGALALAILVLAALVVLAPVVSVVGIVGLVARAGTSLWQVRTKVSTRWPSWRCLLYTSDAADERARGDLRDSGGISKKADK